MISIIIPVIRPESADRCIKAIRKNAGGFCGDIPYEIIAEIDTEGIGCPRMVKKLTEQAKGDLIMFLGDDTIPEPGFLKAALDAMATLPDGWGVVGLNTQHNKTKSNFQAHWLADKRMLQHIPGGAFFPTVYHHCYCDDELMDIAFELGRWTAAEESRIIHNHPINGTAEYDETYQRAYANDRDREDWKTYHRRKIDRKGLNIGVGIPLTGTIQNRLFASTYRQAMYDYLMLPGSPPIREYEPDIPIGQFSRDVAHNRNDLVKQALRDGVSHLIMLDSDQIYPKDIIIKLAAWAARGKDCVVGPVHRRYDPFELILMRGEPDSYKWVPDDEKYSGGMIEIDAAGTGCIMFSMLAALDIPEPWFEIGKTPNGSTMGEDVGFCWNLRKAGYQIWADTSIEIGHLAEIVINKEFHEMWKKLNRVTLAGIKTQ